MKNENPLYLQLKKQLFGEIVNGTRPDGSFLPTEELLAKQYKMSRVTVRRALQVLKSESMIASVSGLGTRVTFRNKGHEGNLNLIALITDSEYDFLKNFMKEFETVADENGGLVMLKASYAKKSFTSGAVFEKLIRANVRNMVLWPFSKDLDPELFARIRAVGGNLVVFDQVLQVPWADTVCLDNTDAMTQIIEALSKNNCQQLALVAFSDLETPTTQFRINDFNEMTLTKGIKSQILRIPFSTKMEETKEGVRQLLHKLNNENNIPDGIIGISGNVGLALALENLKKPERPITIACFDLMEEMQGLKIIAIEQPLQILAKKTYECLMLQNKLGSKWKANTYTFPGNLVIT